MLAEVAPLPASERVAAVRLESYRARLVSLSDEAYRLARYSGERWQQRDRGAGSSAAAAA